MLTNTQSMLCMYMYGAGNKGNNNLNGDYCSPLGHFLQVCVGRSNYES